MTVFEKKQFAVDFATTNAIRTKSRIKRLFWVVRLRLAKWRLHRFMKRTTPWYANKKNLKDD